MNCRITVCLMASLVACILLPHKTCADIIAAWDWNDGTTQGWAGSTTAANVGNILRVTNVGNGSLQIFSPNLSNLDLLDLNRVSFDVSITSYSTVASPSDLTFAELILTPLIPVAPFVIRSWNLDVSNLIFGQTRTFDLSIQNAAGSGSLGAAATFSLLFADSNFRQNTSSALLDNFVVSNAVPECSTLLLVGIGITGLYIVNRRGKAANWMLPKADLPMRSGFLPLELISSSHCSLAANMDQNVRVVSLLLSQFISVTPSSA